MKEKQRSNDAFVKPIPFAVFRAPASFAGMRQVEIQHFQEILEEKLNTLCRSYEVDPVKVNRHHALILAQRRERPWPPLFH